MFQKKENLGIWSFSYNGKCLFLPKIKGSRMTRFLFVNLSLMVFCLLQNRSIAQEVYNDCDKALYLCPLVTQSVSNINATKSLCPGCEDDFTFCFAPNNTIWMKFETNAAGGDVQVNFTNVAIQTVTMQSTEMQATILHAIAPCDASTYTSAGSCEIAATGNFSLTATALLPGTTYYIVVNGSKNPGMALNPAQATMDVTISGPGVERVQPGLALYVPNDTICKGETMTFLAYAGDCPDTADYQWFINGQLAAVTTFNFFETSALQQGDVLSVATSCFESCIVDISATSSPFTIVEFTVDSGPDFSIKKGGSAVLQGATSAPSFSWTPEYSLSASTILKPIAIPEITTTYFLTATQDGCTFSDETTVFVEEELIITNTFTPNGDGYNDTWEIPALENYPNCFIEIYDRWGQSLYQTTGYSAKKAWDGKSKNKLMEAGVYFYVIDVRDPRFNEPFRGSLTLVR